MSSSLRRWRRRRSRRVLAALLSAERVGEEVGLDDLATSTWERPATIAAIRRLEDTGLVVRGPVEFELDERDLLARRPLALTMAGRAAALGLLDPADRSSPEPAIDRAG